MSFFELNVKYLWMRKDDIVPTVLDSAPISKGEIPSLSSQIAGSELEKLALSDSFLSTFVRATMPWSLQRHLGASDIVQSVLIRIQRFAYQFQGDTEAQFQAWVLQIAKRKIVDGIRRYRLSVKVDPEQRASRLMPGCYSYRVRHEEPGSHEDAYEQAELILEALESLPSRIREVVMLRYTREMTFEQISGQLGVPTATCRRRWLAGIEILREKMQHLL